MQRARRTDAALLAGMLLWAILFFASLSGDRLLGPDSPAVPGHVDPVRSVTTP